MENKKMFREGWVTVNDIPTHVMTWGGWIEDEILSSSVLLFIPGNPGITDFYYYFLETLHSITGIPTWIVNHAGNEPVPENCFPPSITKYPEVYNVSDQIVHKKTFIKTYIPSRKKLFLCGHSFGAKVCVELLKDDNISTQLSQAHLVCPTLENIAESFNGKCYKYVVQHIIPVIVSLAWRGWQGCHKETCMEGLLKLFTPKVTKAALMLAKDELHKIKDLDSEVYEAHYDNIFCYYAQTDNWAPLFQYHNLMQRHPKVNGKILDRKFTHDFVLTHPTGMAEELGKNINYSKS